jgi:hypothetical protein
LLAANKYIAHTARVVRGEICIDATRDFSHGELIRDGYDETLTIDPSNLQILYQGRDPESRGQYHPLPYQLGLLKLDDSAK